MLVGILPPVLALLLAASGDAKPIYRGVATDVWSGGCADLAAATNVSWWYNWATQPSSGVTNAACASSWTTPPGRTVQFVPLIWGRNSVTSNVIANLPADTTHLMSFNEPNFSSQSNLSPAEAATLWLQVEQQLSAAGKLGVIKLVAPSASPGGDKMPMQQWLRYFFGNCSTCHFDYQSAHIYDCNAPYFDSGSVGYWIGQYASFGRPIWLTEFACPSNSGTVTEADELHFMHAVLPYLDGRSDVDRYAWFTARATNVGTIPSLFASGAGVLTNVGRLYNSNGVMIPTGGGGGPLPSSSTGPTGGGTGGGGGGGGGGATSSSTGDTGAASSITPALHVPFLLLAVVISLIH